MAGSLKELYPNSLSYIRDQVDWLHHIWTQRPLCSHQESQAKQLKSELIASYPSEVGLIATLDQVLGIEPEIDLEDLELF